jgi:hypothetical protein
MPTYNINFCSVAPLYDAKIKIQIFKLQTSIIQMLSYIFRELKVLNCFYSKSKQAEILYFYTFHQTDVWSHEERKVKFGYCEKATK